MEELKLIIETVAHLPTMTLWVLLGYLVYKLAMIGSVFGLIRYGIQCLHDWLMHRHEVKKWIFTGLFTICVSLQMVLMSGSLLNLID